METEEGRKPQDWKIRQYYQQQEVIDKIVGTAEYREIAPTYPKGYGRRPDAINFPGDFDHFVENGAVAFHASVERWRNPLLIDEVSNLDRLRQNWDLVIDIDCDHSFELSKETAKLVIEELKQHGIENISLKFSGNRGFHIGVRAEAFPKTINDTDIVEMYPKLPRGIIDYIRENLHDELVQKVKEHGLEEEMQTEGGVDPYQVSDIENNWGQRHLFRMPYSLHDGTWLVSLPIPVHDLMSFEKEDAKMENIGFEHDFLDSYGENEGKTLIIQAMDFIEEREEQRKEELQEKAERDFETPDEAIPEEYWPPTIHNILEGLEDGRKRGLFVLINFFRTIGLEWEEIESRIWEWNEENHEPLRESYVKGQLNWHSKRKEVVPPPNYDANGYYRDMQVYEGDNLEERVSNPVSYAFKKSKGQGDNEDGEDDESRMICPYCNKRYQRESYYKKHVQECQGGGEVKKLD
jgi:hypothetical protein